MTKPVNPAAEGATIAEGDIVVPTDSGLKAIRKLYSAARLSTQFRVVDFVGKAIYVIGKPGDEPICLWRNQIKKLPPKTRIEDQWRHASLAEYIP